MADLGRAQREAAASREKAAHDKAAVGKNKEAEAAAGSEVNTSAAGLGAYAKKFARPTPRTTPTPAPTPTATPFSINSPMESNLGKK